MEQSFASLAAQMVNFNKNILELLNKLQAITTSSESVVPISFSDGTTTLNFQISSIGYIQSEVLRLDNTLKSIYGIESNNSYIQTSNSNSFRKIVLVNLNKEPKNIGELNVINKFEKNINSFFDGLLDPMLYVNVDLKDKINIETRKVLVRRYIVDFDKNSDGTLTTAATTALSSFDNSYKNKNNVNFDDFIKWHNTTSGLLSPYYDENLLDLEPNELLYNGYFSVNKIEEDVVNKKIWYFLDKTEYYTVSDGSVNNLKIDDEVILNKDYSNSRYKVIEISYANSLPKVRFQQIEGVESIPVMKSSLKINSTVNYKQNVKISIGFNERCVVFIKALDTNSNLLSSVWSMGSGFWTNDLNLTSNDSDNNKNMVVYYDEVVNDYGQVLSDLVKRKKPVKQGVKPNAPVLKDSNFKVVHVNKHITDSVESKTLSDKYAYQKQLKSEIQQLNISIQTKTKEIRGIGNQNLYNELRLLIEKRDQKNKTYQTAVDDTLSVSKQITKVDAPIYHIRAFWDMPSAINNQEVIQFYVEYKSISKDKSEAPITTIELTDSNASFSNWIPYKTDVRKRIYNPTTDSYTWQIQNVSDADTPNINQLDIPIKTNETIQIRIKAISEVGYPDSILESDWSNVITVDFPDNLSNVLNDNQFILQAASQDDLVVKMKTELSNIISHVDNEVTIGNVTYDHTADKILSGMKDSNSKEMSVYDYLTYLTNTITSLREQINKSLGVLTVSIFRGTTEYIVKSDTELNFTVECEDYLTKAVGNTDGRSGRVYDNSIYTIKDFYISIKNSSVDSSLGLLTNKNNNYNGFYASDVPQSFWFNERDEILFNNSTGKTMTQINNQFIWNVNFTEKTEANTTKTSSDIGNNFIMKNSNSLVDILSQTEYNIGYGGTDILNFNKYNNSLMEMSKWTEPNASITSANKFLTTVHPITQSLEYLSDKNQDLVKILKAQDSINIPINIYFKMNSIDPTSGDGLNYDYIDLNNATTSVRHVKKLKFYLENKQENKAFVFTIKFNLNKNRISVGKFVPDSNLYTTAGNINANNLKQL